MDIRGGEDGLHILLGRDPREWAALGRFRMMLEGSPVYVARVDWVKRQKPGGPHSEGYSFPYL